MSRSILILWTLGAIALAASTALFAGETASNRGKSPQETSKNSSVSGDVTQRRGGSAPGERTSDPENANPAASSPDKAAAERLIQNPDRQEVARDRPEGASPEPGPTGRDAKPGPSIQDRSSEVK